MGPAELLLADGPDNLVSREIEYSVKRTPKRVTFYVLDANNRADVALESVKQRIVQNGGREYDNAGWFALEVVNAFTRTLVGNKEALRPAVYDAIHHIDHYLTHGEFPSSQTRPSDPQMKSKKKSRSFIFQFFLLCPFHSLLCHMAFSFYNNIAYVYIITPDQRQ